MNLQIQKIFSSQNKGLLRAALILFLVALNTESHAGQTALSMHGTAKYEKDFSHFSYVNPAAPIGGSLRLGVIGSFDSLNPFLIKGVPAKGLGLIYQSLLSRSHDEPFSLYANIAKSFDIAPDRKWITFLIDERAQFSDGSPINPSDILYSFEILKTKGRPNHRQYYGTVEKAEIIGQSQIKFTFSGDNVWEMPLIMGLMPILSKTYFESHPFDKTSLISPLGSGPYRAEKVNAGRQIIYRRNAEFWGWDLPQNKGRYNFDHIIFDYFRDSDVALEAFKSGEIDVRFETDPGKWVNSFTAKENEAASFIKEERRLRIPAPLKGLVFNSRREIFNHRDVRKALSFAFDFKWVNKNLLHGAYGRTTSYFQNSPLAAKGLPSGEETALLSPFRDELPPALFNTAYSPPKSDGSGRDRKNLKAARSLLEKAGWRFSGGRLLHSETGTPFEFEILIRDHREVKLLSAFQKNLARLGIKTTLRELDTASYQNRLTNFDFDMIIGQWGQSLSPGNEQSFYWSRQAAETPGSRNYPGINLKSVDHLISLISTARTRDELTVSTRALDRVLLFGHYVIPLYYSAEQWLAHWPHIQLPTKTSFYGTSLDVWWHSPIDGVHKKTP